MCRWEVRRRGVPTGSCGDREHCRLIKRGTTPILSGGVPIPKMGPYPQTAPYSQTPLDKWFQMPLSRMPFLICRRLFALLSQLPFSICQPGTLAACDICCSGHLPSLDKCHFQPTPKKWYFCLLTFATCDICRLGTFAALGHLPLWDICHPETFATLRHLPF